MDRVNLTNADLENLSRSFIDADLAAQAGLFRVDSYDGGQIIGRNGGGDYAGIVFSYCLPGRVEPRDYRLRRDNPDLEVKSDGTVKPKGKYLSPRGRGNLLYFPPNAKPNWLSATAIPICITEGEKKTLALWRLAWHGLGEAKENPRFFPIGLPGAWNWRGKTGSAGGPNGERRDVKGPIADLDLIEWQTRTVFIVFDANVNSNPTVNTARRGLAKELRKRGAKVRYVDLPEIEGINGVDDLLGREGADSVLALFDDAREAQDEQTKESPSSVLVALASSAVLFHDSEGTGYATIKINGHFEHWPLNSKGFKEWLGKHYFESEGKVPTGTVLTDALNTLQGKARFHGSLVEVHTRLAAVDGFIWLDLCNPDWQIVKIGPNGWSIVTDAPFKFRRAGGMRPLAVPVLGGSIESLRSLVNVKDADWPLLVAWLVTALRPGKPFPVLAIHGEQGSAKSTVCKILRSLIDPNKAPLRSEPKEERDLILAATNGWLVALDNLSYLNPRLADALCRLSTGGGFGTRKLYENDEETLFEAMRPILLNGIEELATRGDLLDRTIILHLPTIGTERRRTETELWREFDEKKALILGALLTGVSRALRDFETVVLPNKPRMADFAEWAIAAEPSFGFAPGEFIGAYRQNRRSANEIVLEASPIASCVVKFARERGRWQGNATALLTELSRIADDSVSSQKGWPKRANMMSGALNRIAPNLRASGIACSITRNSAGSFITLAVDGNESSSSSPSSGPSDSGTAINPNHDDMHDGV